MDKKEFATIAMAIKAAYPNANLMPDDRSKEVWYTMLADIEYPVCMLAIKELISTNVFPPAIAEIREKCSNLKNKPVADWSDAWGQVTYAIRKYGMYEEEKALESMDMITRTLVKRFGYKFLCTSDDEMANRAHFKDAYNLMAKEYSMNNQIPSPVLAEKQRFLDSLVEGTIGALEDRKTESKDHEIVRSTPDFINKLLSKYKNGKGARV